MQPVSKTFRVITNPAGPLEFPWSGEKHVLPPGTHIVADLWPGKEELVDVALELFSCEEGVKVFETEFEVTYKPKDAKLVAAVQKTAAEAKRRLDNARKADEADRATRAASAEEDRKYLADKAAAAAKQAEKDAKKE